MLDCPVVDTPEAQQALWLQGYGSGLVALNPAKHDAVYMADELKRAAPFTGKSKRLVDDFFGMNYLTSGVYPAWKSRYERRVKTDFSEVEGRVLEGLIAKPYPYEVAEWKLDSELLKDVKLPDYQKRLYELLMNTPPGDLKVQGTRTGRMSFTKPNVSESPTGRTNIPIPETQDIKFANGSTIKALPVSEGSKIRGSRYMGDPAWTAPSFVKEGNKTDAKVRVRASSYLSDCLRGDDIHKLVMDTVECLKDVEFDAIAYRGNSGALVGPAVAALMKKHVLMVRKLEGGDANCHSSMRVEGVAEAVRYVIVDDFIASGRTVGVIVDDISRYMNEDSKCVGLVEYTKVNYNTRESYDVWHPETRSTMYSIPVFSL